MSDQDYEDPYPCIGVCMADPVSGLCQGCGRPLAEPEAVSTPVSTTHETGQAAGTKPTSSDFP